MYIYIYIININHKKQLKKIMIIYFFAYRQTLKTLKKEIKKHPHSRRSM